MTDTQIEQEIQAKGLTAPRITPADIEANIASEHYFTGADGFRFKWLTEDHASALDRDNVESIAQGIRIRTHSATSAAIDASAGTPPMLGMLTFCVLVTRNGHLVSGEAYCADPAKFNAETGCIEARKVAIDKLWPMVVYAERERLAAMDAVIDRSNPATLPPKGEWLVTVDTDDGREVQVLLHKGNGKWLHEGEYTFQHDYYFRPVAWAPRPEACSGPVPAED